MKKILLITALFTIGFSTIAQVNLSRSSKSNTEILNEQYASSLFKNAEGTVIDVENENVQSYFNILDWLNGRVAGLQIYITRTGTRVPVIRGSAATIFVDEIRMDPSYLNFLSVNDIAMIKVIKGPFAGAIGNGGGGTIAIYTIKGDDEEEEERPSQIP
jgi:outer membrane receptor for ferrienterochelin and colicin